MPLPTVVAGPRAMPGRRGLLNSITTPAGAVTGRLGPGSSVQFRADICDAADPESIDCTFPQDKPDLTIDPSSEWFPFIVYGYDVCSAMSGLDFDERERRAIDNLLATASYQAEREFFDGVATAGDVGRENDYLTVGNATAVTGAATSPTIGGALLDGELTECLHGQRGMIHAHPTVVALWFAADLIRVEGSQLLTVNDHIVVSGSGYSGNDIDGDAPAAGESWAYGTPLVYGARGEARAVGAPNERVDSTLNTIETRAEQEVALWMAGCCKLAAQISIDGSP